MYCTQCGFKLEESDRFCAQCGKPTWAEGERPQAAYYAPRRLKRLMYDKKVAGVCSGIAKYLDVDVSLVRVLVLCFALVTGVGFIAYILAWIVMPKDYGYPVVGQAPQPASASSPAS